ncbi:MAG: hypothetical protein AAB930_01545 [Patescibacteria group bacterium]
MLGRLLLVLCSWAILAGCSVPIIYVKQDLGLGGRKITIPSGFTIVNESGRDIEEKMKAISDAVELGFETLKTCINDSEFPGQELKDVPLVLLPPEMLYVLGKKSAGFADGIRIYLRSDYIWASKLRHEWIHVYLWRTGRRAFGDIFHRDPLFKKCEYVLS